MVLYDHREGEQTSNQNKGVISMVLIKIYYHGQSTPNDTKTIIKPADYVNYLLELGYIITKVEPVD